MEKTAFNSIEIGPKVTPLNKSQLYRVDTYTDMQSGSLICFQPISWEGPFAETPIFFAQTYVSYPGSGPIEVKAELKAKTLPDAVEEFSSALAAEIKKIEVQLNRRQMESTLNGRTKQ